MKNPDHWLPPNPQGEPTPPKRDGALIGLAVIALLIVGGLVLAHVLANMARLQDCALSGRSNCSMDH
jgi:hypothetical protein